MLWSLLFLIGAGLLFWLFMWLPSHLSPRARERLKICGGWIVKMTVKKNDDGKPR